MAIRKELTFHHFCAQVQAGKYKTEYTSCPHCEFKTKLFPTGNHVGGKVEYRCEHCNGRFVL